MSENVKYTKDHEIVKIDGDVVSVGITGFACEALGDLVYVELPSVGDNVSRGSDFAVVESVKTASEVYSPVSGEIVAVNDALANTPDLLKENIDKGWIVKIKIEDKSELDKLLDEDAYQDLINNQ